LLTVEAAKTAAAAIVGTRLDYCNSLLYGSTDRNLNRLQRAQNTLARVVLQAPTIREQQWFAAEVALASRQAADCL